MKKIHLLMAASAIPFVITGVGAQEVRAQELSEAEHLDQSAAQYGGTIVVTARKREENVQEVPDAITVLSSELIENAGITNISAYTGLVPNVNFRDGSAFSKGFFFFTVRGVGNGQQGWPATTVTVDGVRNDSLDILTAGSLVDIERIEVLRGPQSALYGAGAIAGAINIVTQDPSNELEGRVSSGYGRGDDWVFQAMVSGPIVEDKLLFRVNGYYRDFDGLIDSASTVGQGAGIDLDFERTKQFNGQLQYLANDNLTIDIRYRFIDETNGATYQDKVASPDLIDVFNNETAARRRNPWAENRVFHTASLKVTQEFESAELISVTGYNNSKSDGFSSVCWDDPDDPAIDTDPNTPGVQIGCFNSPALGSFAGPNEIVDSIFDSGDSFATWSNDTRLVSTGDTNLRWLAGFEILDRTSRNGFNIGPTVGPLEVFDPINYTFVRWDERRDFWWGVYSQLSYDMTDSLELTFAGRYDKTRYRNTQYLTDAYTSIVQNPDTSGNFVDTLQDGDGKFQPKITINYQLNNDVMLYSSWSRGFRAGFFNTGSFTRSEETTNYEIGFKSSLFENSLLFNVAAFHIDYSDQQFSTVIGVPPFRIPVTVPKTNIDGLEVDFTFRPSRSLQIIGGAGYLDARQATGIRSPFAPKFNANLNATYSIPINNNFDFVSNVSWRYNSSQFANANEQSLVPSKQYVDLRAGLRTDSFQISAWVRNALNTREATSDFNFVTGGYIRYQNRPASYGIEVRQEF